MVKYGKNNAYSRSVQLPVCDRSTVSEISGDFALPDYQPEIKKLLRVTASMLPASKYIGERSAEFSGNIDYYVTYVGADNQIYCVPVTTEYKVEIPVESAEMTYLEGATGYAIITPDNVSGRVTSPRKLSIKCRLRTRARIFGEMPLDDRFGAGDGSLEVLYGIDESARTLISMGEMLRLSDEIVISGLGDEVRVILADGRALIDEVTCSDGAVNCRGNLYLKLLMSREDASSPYTVTRKIPFSQSIATEGVSHGDAASARGSVCEMSVSVEDGRIALDVGMLIECNAVTTDVIKFVKDVYSTTSRVEADYKVLNFPQCELCENKNFTLSESMPLEEAGISPTASVIDLSGSVYPDSYSFDGERCTVSGRVRYDLLLENGGEYSSATIEIPFKYETKAPDCFAAVTSDALFVGEVINARARVDGERIGIDSEIGMSGCGFEVSQTKILDKVSFGDAIGRRAGEYTVCYPDKSDSLWSVAKRYGAPIDTLISSNGLSGDCEADATESLAEIKYLII